MKRQSNSRTKIKQTRRVAGIIRILKKLFPLESTSLEYRTPWELLVAVVLSAQCTDKKVNEVTKLLFKKYKTLESYICAQPREFERDIYSTGFYRTKAKNILRAARVVKERFDGKLPRTIVEMITIPGVGRKSANVVLGNIYDVVEGIAVDTHVKRLTRVLGLTTHTNPEIIERELMEYIPKREWFNFTNRLIAYGRNYCPARKHQHNACPLHKFHIA